MNQNQRPNQTLTNQIPAWIPVTTLQKCGTLRKMCRDALADARNCQ